MPTMTTASEWRVIARSERGASHIRSNLPNQDVVKFFTSPDGTTPAILAVADGHGSPRSFRSDIGALFAAESAVSVCSEFLGSIRDASASVIKNSAEQQIPRRIIDKWRQRVTQHFNANPFLPAELGLVGKERYPVAYGSTILLAAVTDQFLLFFQLGDGEMLVVSDSSGEVTRPIPRDEALIANETTSLCMENPLPEFRFRFQYVRDNPPGIVLLSTDGYPNSFRSQEGFLKVGTDLLEMLRTDGGDSVENDLPGWLQEASTSGSGDDVTLGIVYRLEPSLRRPDVAPLAENPPLPSVAHASQPVGDAAMPTDATASHEQLTDASNSSLGTSTAIGKPSDEPTATSGQGDATGLSPTDVLRPEPGQDSVAAPGKSGSSTLHREAADTAGIAP